MNVSRLIETACKNVLSNHKIGMFMHCLREFHKAGGLINNNRPTVVDDKTQLLRINLMEEELSELIAAMGSDDIVEIADGLGDLLYVVFGTAVSYGIPIEKVFLEIHENNMTKFDGQTEPRADGKIMKPANYKPVDLSWVKLLIQ